MCISFMVITFPCGDLFCSLQEQLGPYRENIMVENKITRKTNLEALNFQEDIKLTESFQPCLAACHVEPAQLQN